MAQKRRRGAGWWWVLEHYRFDPERNERRNVAVAAYDTERELDRALARYSERIRAEIAAGTRDARERVSGTVRHPGHRAEQDRGHAVRRAVQHGADPRPLLRDGPLPSNIGVFGVDEDGSHFSFGGGEPPSPER